MAQTIGVLAVQGDFECHIRAISRLNRPELTTVEVRTKEDLARIDRLIIPGGESTTVSMLLKRFGLFDEICNRAKVGMPIWGTCMGLILLAKKVEGHENLNTLGLLDVTVRRNAFGAQVHSFEAQIPISELGLTVSCLFIRAPIITELGAEVRILAEFQGNIVAVQQGRILGTSFHPELTLDTQLHEHFVTL